MKKLIVLSLVLTVASSLTVSAQTPSYTAQLVESVVEQESVSVEDLGLSKPTLLPTSPFYFFKDFRRAIQGFFTFNSVKKADLDLRFADERLAEAKAMVEQAPEKIGALEKAIDSYKIHTDALKGRLEGLRETSQNPNVDKLLEKVTDRAIKHEKLFDELIVKSSGIQEVIAPIQGKIFEAVSVIPQKFDTPEKFVQRLETVFEKQEGSYLKPLRAIEIIDRLETRISEEARFKLYTYRNDLLDKARVAIEGAIEQSPEAVSELFKILPGDQTVRGKIFFELKEKFEAPQAVQQFKQLETIYFEGFKEEVGRDKALAAIKSAEERINELRNRLGSTSIPVPVPGTPVPLNVQPSVGSQQLTTSKLTLPSPYGGREAARELLQVAEKHLANAKTAFEQGRFGEAYGQATAAEANARKGLSMLGEREPDYLRDALKRLELTFNELREKVKSRGWTEQDHPDVFRLIALSEGLFEQARQLLESEDKRLPEVLSLLKEVIYKLEWLVSGGLVTPGPKPIPVPGPEPVPVPELRVLSPKEGEQWLIGKTYTISWQTLYPIKTINISLDTGIRCVTTPCPSDAIIAENISTENYGSYRWTVTDSGGLGTYPRAQIFVATPDDKLVGRSGYFSIVSGGIIEPPQPSNLPPVIDGEGGPTSLKVEETGTWTVKAHDPDGTYLFYSVDWGDNATKPTISKQAPALSSIQEATFTHSYSSAGTYKIVFTVSDDKGANAQTSLTVSVIGTISIPGPTSQIQILSPNGGETWEAGLMNYIKWKMPSDQIYHVALYLMPQGSTPVKLNPAAPGTSDVMIDPAVGGYNIGGQTLKYLSSQGSYVLIISPLMYPEGIYKIRAYLMPGDMSYVDASRIIAQDESDVPFSLVSAPTSPVVNYTDSGYSPQTILVKKGTTVVFKNSSSREMRPASAIHPTHAVYPTTGGCITSTFDACRGLKPGESWSFVFDIRGAWKYHDHLKADYTGTVIVE